jgi:2-oxo-3-(phosphooxy)propyl 3-oxoalkanoate synthase
MLPPNHALYHHDGAGRTDPMMVVEALRQAAYFISHRFYGVPHTHEFILGGLAVKTDDPALPAAGTEWLPVNLRVTCAPTAKWTRRRLGMRLDVEFSMGGRACGHGSLLSEAVDMRVYQAVRRRSAPPGAVPAGGRPLSPAEVGRRRRADVLLTVTGRSGSWLLRVDRGHPVMFDHPVDHVPGMVLLEAFRQAALVVTRPLAARRPSLAGLRTEFARFCELDVPTLITARLQAGHPVAGRALVCVAARQADTEVAAGALELRLDALAPYRTSGAAR